MADRINVTYRLGESAKPQAATSVAGPPQTPVTHPAPALNSFDLFPTRVWQLRLDALATHFPRWVAEVLAMRAASPRAGGRTNRQGWNSEEMTVPSALSSRRCARRCAPHAVAPWQRWGRVSTPTSCSPGSTCTTAGVSTSCTSTKGRCCPGSFYLQVPPGSGAFVFRDPRPGVIHGLVKGAVANGHGDVHLNPSTGLLVLFPCWIEHYVEPHGNDTPRITIAFNANAPEGEARRR